MATEKTFKWKGLGTEWQPSWEWKRSQLGDHLISLWALNLLLILFWKAAHLFSFIFLPLKSRLMWSWGQNRSSSSQGPSAPSLGSYHITVPVGLKTKGLPLFLQLALWQRAVELRRATQHFTAVMAPLCRNTSPDVRCILLCLAETLVLHLLLHVGGCHWELNHLNDIKRLTWEKAVVTSLGLTLSGFLWFKALKQRSLSLDVTLTWHFGCRRYKVIALLHTV